MGFQTAIFQFPGFGVPGDIFNNAPSRAWSYILNSVSAAYNVIGTTFYTRSTTDGFAQAGNTGGTGLVVGLLVNSKAYVSFGTSGGGPLAPTMTLPNNVNAELATEGSFYCIFPANCHEGDLVVFDNTTGQISTIVPGANLPVGKTFAEAVVDYYDVTTGVGVITLLPTLVTPVLAGLQKESANSVAAKKSEGAK